MVLTDVISARTIRISNTLRFASSDGVRVGNQSRFTPTDGVARGSNSTPSSRSTGAGHTRIRSRNTFLGFTNIVSRTVRVNDTFRSTTSDGVRLRNQTRLTP